MEGSTTLKVEYYMKHQKPRNQKKTYVLIKDLHEEVRHVSEAFARNFELGDGCEVVYLSICS